MEGCYVTTTAARWRTLAVVREALVLVGYLLRCPILRGISCEAVLDERVYIDAEVHPAVTHDSLVRNSCMHLIYHYTLRTIAKHQPSPSLKMETKTNDLSKLVAKTVVHHIGSFSEITTYIMLVPHVKLKREGLARGHIELEDEKLVHDVET